MTSIWVIKGHLEGFIDIPELSSVWAFFEGKVPAKQKYDQTFWKGHLFLLDDDDQTLHFQQKWWQQLKTIAPKKSRHSGSSRIDFTKPREI